jgi:L-histidine Nalpha-methyltransferase
MIENVTSYESTEALNLGLLKEVLMGFSQRRKRLPSKLLYDQRGSELFEEICRLKDYYPTRAEIEILSEYGASIAKLIGPGAMILEPGSGAGEKIRYLFQHLSSPVAYVPIEISTEILARMLNEFEVEFPKLPVFPVSADFTQDFSLPEAIRRWDGRKTIFFPGSTIGNFAPSEAVTFLRRMGTLIGPGGGLLIGVDKKKDPKVLKRAYDDSRGITAKFNLNLLHRINREAQGNFKAGNFEHVAFYDETHGRVEMHLMSRVDQVVSVHGSSFLFQAGETIHTENSYKYTVQEFQKLGEEAGYRLNEWWQDSSEHFCVYYFERG